MLVSFQRDLPIKALPIDEHYGLKKDKYDVKDIAMSQSSTSVYLMGHDKVFNSVHFKFYLHNEEIDIYNSGLFNHYRALSLPMVKYVNKED